MCRPIVLPAVAEALHVAIPDGGWSVCAGAPFNYKRTMKDERTTIYPALIGKIQVHIYNGEADACVPHSDNEWWTDRGPRGEVERQCGFKKQVGSGRAEGRGRVPPSLGAEDGLARKRERRGGRGLRDPGVEWWWWWGERTRRGDGKQRARAHAGQPTPIPHPTPTPPPPHPTPTPPTLTCGRRAGPRCR